MAIEKVPVGSSLLLLHLSDIHFREPYCLNLETDQDHPVRQAMLYDIRTMVDRLGPVDAILVSGDIASTANLLEYQVAALWLSEVAHFAGCTPNSIYTVPGNHDVDRNIAGLRTVQGVRGLIHRHQSVVERDQELHDTFLDEKTGIELLMPMAQYNLFAASFGCDLIPERPFWVQELSLAPGWKLKMHGLTTTFLSGPDDDIKGALHLGALQRVFATYDGVVRLAMLHHPPDWLADHDELDDALWNSCAVHLLGHKHRQRYRIDTNGVRLAAGAVNPSRTEGTWEPGYNLVKLQIVENLTQSFLKIESYLRIWQDNPDHFVAKKTLDDGDIFEHTVPLRHRPLPIPATKAEEVPLMEGNVNNSGTPSEATEAPMNIMSQRDLVFDFWKLSPSQRRKIMQALDLLEPTDDQLPEPQRYRLAFERARDRGIIEKLKDEVYRTLTS